MGLMTIIVILVLAVAAFLLVRASRRDEEKTEAKQASTRQRKDTTYHAVSIKYDKGACQAAKNMMGRRFLATAAPRLPLPDCDAAECNCRFAHHDDRRTGKDRRSPFGPSGRLSGSGEFEQEKRTGEDRRKGDEDS